MNKRFAMVLALTYGSVVLSYNAGVANAQLQSSNSEGQRCPLKRKTITCSFPLKIINYYFQACTGQFLHS